MAVDDPETRPLGPSSATNFSRDNMSFGGGFMNGSQGDSASPGGGKKGSDKNSIRPVTIAQILAAYQPHPDAEFTIDAVEINQLTFIGKVMNCVRNSTNVSCTVEDGTGQIDMRQWVDTPVDEEGSEAPADGIVQDALVRVVGTVKVFHGKRSINAISIRPITDMNEQQFHLLEVIYVHLYMTKGPLSGQATGSTYNQGATSYGQQNGNNANPAQAYAELSGAQRKIMQYIASLGVADQLPSEGVNVQAIVRSTGIDYDRVKEEVDSLVLDGQLYTTADEDHVMPT